MVCGKIVYANTAGFRDVQAEVMAGVREHQESGDRVGGSFRRRPAKHGKRTL